MTPEMTGLAIGILFGASLVVSGLADPDKIIGTLRLKDLHVLRTIAVFVLTGMVGTWVLHLFGAAHFSIKPAFVVSVLAGGAIMGVGFGLTGYCPGTGLACAAMGRLDALAAVLGMSAGALVFIFLYPAVGAPLQKVWDLGKVTLPEMTGIPYAAWVLGLGGLGSLALWATRKK